MKEIKKERTTTQTYYEYEAMDGTVFNDKEECKKYENTAECAIMTKYRSLVLSSKHTQYELFGIGNDDDNIDLVKVKNQDDIDTVMQAWLITNRFYQEDKYESQRNSNYEMLKKAMEEDDIIFINHGYDNDNFWVDGTRNSMIAKMNSLDQIIKEKNHES